MTEAPAAPVALVTGASRGIGRAVALRLARDGYDVALVQRGAAADVVAEIEALGRRALAVPTDLADVDAALAAVATAVETLGGLDALVLNAGTIIRHPAVDYPLEDWRRTFDVNLTTPFALAQAAARRWIAAERGGRIVAMASVLGFQGGVHVPAYSASKSALRNLVAALANEWAPLGINVNCVAPGYVDTELTEALRDDAERRRSIDARIPAGRWATPDDVASAVAFLVSPDAGYVHGHTLVVDGGWLGR